MLNLLIATIFLSVGAFAEQKIDTAKIETLTQLKGKLNEKEGVFKVTYPRDDLTVTAAGVNLAAVMGLTAWTSFTQMNNHCMIMGDLVMTEDQVNDVMSVALENGLEVTALHNHFFGDTPKVMFMHIGGMGELEKLAKGVGAAFQKLKATAAGKGSFPSVKIDVSKSHIDGRKIEAVLGYKGQDMKGAYKVTIGRNGTMSGVKVGNEMGINTWATFGGTDKEAVVAGDFAMFPGELQEVLKALRSHNINIVAIHNHMADEEPRMTFLHFWGVGPTEKLAAGLKAALATQKL